mmetsp:Transcript_41764/g.83709  ORF Transcript_41764/g.83709 Transcript_41764/m.83709 type:complete len:119 (+) Transcript_41764:114-470(+)
MTSTSITITATMGNIITITITAMATEGITTTSSTTASCNTQFEAAIMRHWNRPRTWRQPRSSLEDQALQDQALCATVTAGETRRLRLTRRRRMTTTSEVGRCSWQGERRSKEMQLTLA